MSCSAEARVSNKQAYQIALISFKTKTQVACKASRVTLAPKRTINGNT